MTRKDYVLIAAALKEARSSYTIVSGVAIYHNGVDNAATRLADALARDNARFDRERFLKAAGVSNA